MRFIKTKSFAIEVPGMMYSNVASRLLATKRCIPSHTMRNGLALIGQIARGLSQDSKTDAIWNEMNERSQLLALQLVGDDLIGSDRPLEEVKKHNFARRRSLSQAITMIESRSPTHVKQANLLLTYLLAHENHKRKGTSFRLGIAGSPGAGKSTFVEAFGEYLLDIQKYEYESKQKKSAEGSKADGKVLKKPKEPIHKLAVVCIDPSSAVTGGSILGDKTRMTELSRHERCYVRPSPTKNVLGGLTAYTEDVVSICQVAGYDLVVIETVGLGQSEIEVKESVDMLLLMVPPGGGDDLQGIKKGIVEVCDMLVVTKADGKFLQAARRTANDYKGALKSSRCSHVKGWEVPPVLLVSSQEKEGIDKLWTEICRFRKLMAESGELELRRQKQSRYWLWKNVQSLITEQTQNDSDLRAKAKSLEKSLDEGKITPRVAATELIESLVRRNEN